ncbi:corticosteroid-binding globulin-like isoform X2 [Ornithorhynchus anatinus]|uniref:corticosteroid-binding globulin-like isoform X2 n=1 Tax=Ornithorhynchus anatinus TaxID=9258 RepID=UPI000223E910|nr:corticosteroid-binding globulin-like isoform X2 [Ornithorhynchus anatinus]
MQSPLHFWPTSFWPWAILYLVFRVAVISCDLACYNIAPSNIDFAFKLYQQLTSKSPDHNILYSPVGVSSTLATLSLGARSDTQTQIWESLQFQLTELSQDEILEGCQCIQTALNTPGALPPTKIGSALFVSPGALPPPVFTDKAADVFGSEIIYADFQDPAGAKFQINNYGEEQTFGRIEDVTPALNTNTLQVLMSTSRIEGQWDFPFDVNQTIEEMDFFVDDRRVVKVPAMYQKGQFDIYRDEGVACTLINKKFFNTSGMYFILPDKGKMQQVEEAMSGALLLKWMDNNVLSDAELYIPKFSLSTNYKLEKILPNLGIEDLFTQQANLSGLTNQSGVAVSKVWHRATLEVKEDGLVAVGSMGTVVSSGPARTLPPPSTLSPPVHRERPQTSFQSPIRFNRPFLVGVFHKAAFTTLFWGKVVNPALHGGSQGPENEA